MARPKGSGNKATKEIKELLDSNKTVLLTKAITMATDRENPNVPILMKLLDKILPTLTMAEFDANLRGSLMDTLPEAEIQKIVKRIVKQTNKK